MGIVIIWAWTVIGIQQIPGIPAGEYTKFSLQFAGNRRVK